jgi:hypothetical protein
MNTKCGFLRVLHARRLRINTDQIASILLTILNYLAFLWLVYVVCKLDNDHHAKLEVPAGFDNSKYSQLLPFKRRASWYYVLRWT